MNLSFGSLVLSKFLAEHVTGQFRLPIPVAPCLMEATWFPTVLNMLVHFLIGVPMYNISSWIFQWTEYLFNPLAAHRCVLCSRGSYDQSIRQWPGQLKYL